MKLGHKIDKEVRQALRPINLMQNLVLNPRYQIKNDLLTDKVGLWNTQLLLIKNTGCSRLHSIHLFRAYVQILQCYEIILDVYEGPFIYQSIDAFFQSLIEIKIFVAFGNDVGWDKISVLVYILSWIVKSVLIQFTLSLTFDTFYQTVDLAQTSCMLNSTDDKCTDDQRKLCKNVMRLHRASFSKLCVCGMFYVDICHPLRLMILLTNYTVITIDIILFIFITSLITHEEHTKEMNINVGHLIEVKSKSKTFLDNVIDKEVQLVKLLTDKMLLWESQLLYAQNNGCSKSYSSKMYRAYVLILKCYEIIQNAYGVP
ncbi:hypothetical protein HW555_010368, partial [Spodoptera exigua]